MTVTEIGNFNVSATSGAAPKSETPPPVRNTASAAWRRQPDTAQFKILCGIKRPALPDRHRRQANGAEASRSTKRWRELTQVATIVTREKWRVARRGGRWHHRIGNGVGVGCAELTLRRRGTAKRGNRRNRYHRRRHIEKTESSAGNWPHRV